MLRQYLGQLDRDPLDMWNMGSVWIGAGLGDRVSGCLGLLISIGHPFVKGKLTLYPEVCMVNCANVFLVFLLFVVGDRPTH